MTTEICQSDQKRRQAIRARLATGGQPALNGLDYIEVSDDGLTLTVYFLDKAPENIRPANIKIEGGRRIRNIKVVDIRLCRLSDPTIDDCMQVRVDKIGDFSTYTLCLIETDDRGRPTGKPLPGFDRRYTCLSFNFRINCPSDLDCKSEVICPPEALPEPEIDYLAKDYASFRQLILDRLALLLPDWKERHVPDLNIALVEILAYTGDYLSYYQDAVATEAYLDTARQRISVRRHARLVDYIIHEGCNARAWLFIETRLADVLDLNTDDIYFITGVDASYNLNGPMLAEPDLQNIAANSYEVFEAVSPAPISLYQSHNQIHLYSWGAQECCLPQGSTSATLVGQLASAAIPVAALPAPAGKGRRAAATSSLPLSSPPSSNAPFLYLKEGDFLLFEEVVGPKTGQAADANLSHRQVVRLTKVESGRDELYDLSIVEIEWAEEDALLFPLCLSAITPASDPPCQYIENISVARGNLILVDHGRRIQYEPLGTVPEQPVTPECEGENRVDDQPRLAGRFGPTLKQAPLTYRQPLPLSGPASNLLLQNPRRALPQMQIIDLPPQSQESAVAALPPGSPAIGNIQPASAKAALTSPPSDSAVLGGEILSIEAGSLTLATGDEPIILNQFTQVMLDNRLQPLTVLRAGQKVLVQTQRGADGQLVATKITLLSKWLIQNDLLASLGEDYHFVVETDNDGYGHLRFGDGELGSRPAAGTTFSASYRVGNGPSGNVGAETIRLMVFRQNKLNGPILTPRNPLESQGGISPEPLAEIKLFAPRAFRKELQRAITPADYAELTQRNPKVQRAAADLRWTGSWYEMQVAVDPLGNETLDPALKAEIYGYLYPYRRIGYDLAIVQAEYVPLDLALEVCVKPDYLRGHIKAALLDLFSNRILPDGSKGFFHPDNLSFGVGIYLSKIVALAQAVAGVESVRVKRLQRLGKDANHEIANGVLPLKPLEIAQLDTSLPELGRLALDIRGGR